MNINFKLFSIPLQANSPQLLMCGSVQCGKQNPKIWPNLRPCDHQPAIRHASLEIRWLFYLTTCFNSTWKTNTTQSTISKNPKTCKIQTHLLILFNITNTTNKTPLVATNQEWTSVLDCAQGHPPRGMIQVVVRFSLKSSGLRMQILNNYVSPSLDSHWNHATAPVHFVFRRKWEEGCWSSKNTGGGEQVLTVYDIIMIIVFLWIIWQ